MRQKKEKKTDYKESNGRTKGRVILNFDTKHHPLYYTTQHNTTRKAEQN